MVEIKRKKGETFEAFFRRFVRQLQRSGRLQQARKVRFLSKTKSRPEQRKDAQTRATMRAKKEYLKKVGRLPEEDNPRRRGNNRSR